MRYYCRMTTFAPQTRWFRYRALHALYPISYVVRYPIKYRVVLWYRTRVSVCKLLNIEISHVLDGNVKSKTKYRRRRRPTAVTLSEMTENRNATVIEPAHQYLSWTFAARCHRSAVNVHWYVKNVHIITLPSTTVNIIYLYAFWVRVVTLAFWPLVAEHLWCETVPIKGKCFRFFFF